MLTQKELKENLHYNSDTGVFTWLRRAGKRKAGDIAGYANKGYIQIEVNQEAYKAHRLAWLYVNGEFPLEQIDHINHNKVDNSIANLRCVSNRENHHNRTMNINNSSGFTGVHWHKSNTKWAAQVRISGKCKFLGYFYDLNDAIAARRAANLKYNFHTNHGAA